MIDATLAAIPADAAATIERQLAIRTRAVRIIDDEDVMLYGPTNGEPDPALALPNRSPDFRLATVSLRGPRGEGSATVSCVHGWLFMLAIRPAPKRIGPASAIEVVSVTVRGDPLEPVGGEPTRWSELPEVVRAEIDRAIADGAPWVDHLVPSHEADSVTLDDGEYLVLSQLPDTDLIVAALDAGRPSIRRYDSSGDLVGEYATVQEAVLATR